MAEQTPYLLLAERLDRLPNGFPPAENGAHLRLLAKLFSSEEAALAAQLSDTLETVAAIAARLYADPARLRLSLKEMTRRGLIAAGKTAGGMGYALMPFVVGIYEMQFQRIDAELARLVEDYFLSSFPKMLAVQPPFHRVIPVRESVGADISVAPYESAVGIVSRAAAWGVLDCICRKQSALVGRSCPHPVEVCMVLASSPGAFHGRSGIRELTLDGALGVMRIAAEAGLVHSVANTREGNWYICNCCTCACGILRGMAKGGIASVVARSGFVCRVEEISCSGCGLCEEKCPFGAITCNGAARVDAIRCAGCGVCTVACPSGALTLVARPAGEITPPPADEAEWRTARAAWRSSHPD